MGKKLRSSSQPIADEIISYAPSQFFTKSGKSSLKTLISTVSPSSDLISSLPPSLYLAISQTLESFKISLHCHEEPPKTPPRSSSLSPPLKRSRRFARSKAGNEEEKTLEHLKKLQCYAFIAHQMISHPKQSFSATDLLPSVQLLHDSLVLYEMDPALLSSVSYLCEDWWKEKLLGREKLISQSLPFLLSKSLSNGKKADVHRVYALREALLLFDYLDESIGDLKLLLSRCVIEPVYLKTDEGRKFVAFMMGLNDQLAKEILALIKSQIQFGKKSILEAYADILFRAWKGSEDCLRNEIEDGFVQGLLDSAVHASSKPLAAHIRRVLGGFIEQRATEGVEKLLFRLSEPLLFRSLQAANSNVRQNALLLFLDMFPLEDPDVTKEVKDALLDKQFFLLERLLLDDCPDVRAIAVEGSCRILNLFWEVIPSEMITKILTKLIDSMSHDVCNEVRLSTVNGIIYLLENPQSHEIMKVLLPRLGFLISDPSLSVRVAVTDLLLAVRDIRTFQFNKVVDLDVLLSSLDSDHDRVAEKITRLLIPSYFPSKVTPKEACSRCIALIKRSPTAGARFCEFAVSEGSSPKSLLELLRVTISLALSPNGLNSGQVDGLFVASANICHSLSSELSNKTALSDLLSSAKLKCLFTSAPSQRAKTAVLTIYSIIQLDDSPGFRELCTLPIINCIGLVDDIEKQALVRAAHKVMLSSGWSTELIGLLTSRLQTIASAFIDKFSLEPPQLVVQSLKKKKVKAPMKISVKSNHCNLKDPSNSSMSKIEEDLSAAAATAWQMKDLLATIETKNALLKSPNLEIALSALRIVSQVTIQQCLSWELLDTSAISAYTAFTMQMSLQNAVMSCGDKDNDTHSTNMSPAPAILDNTLSHLVNCAEKLFSLPVSRKSINSPSKTKHDKGTASRQKSRRKDATSSTPLPSEGGQFRTILPEAKIVQNILKIVTTILKLIADAASIGQLAHNHTTYLKFASSYSRNTVSLIRGQQSKSLSLKEEDLKDVLLYMKSSFSYASKLLHLSLTSSSESSAPPSEAFDLANDLLDQIVSVESYLGRRNASNLVSVAKPWLPVIMLGLGSKQLIQSKHEESTSNSCSDFATVPLWLVVLSKNEVHEYSKLNSEQSDDVSESSAFEQLMEMVVVLLKKGNMKVMDSVGAVVLRALEFAIEVADFGLVLGLLHFTCVKLMGKESTYWRELELVPKSLQEIYSKIVRVIGEAELSEEGRRLLESAAELLGSFCTDPE